MARDYICLYHSYLDAIQALGDAERGRLFTAMLEYSMTGEAPQLNGNERFIFPMMKAQIDRDNARDTSGPNHWNWKGGITPKNQIGRNSVEAHQWRKAVFSRDNYTCMICGTRGVRLNAHHIKQWAKFPELRYAVYNGITLCELCHKAIHRRNKA